MFTEHCSVWKRFLVYQFGVIWLVWRSFFLANVYLTGSCQELYLRILSRGKIVGGHTLEKVNLWSTKLERKGKQKLVFRFKLIKFKLIWRPLPVLSSSFLIRLPVFNGPYFETSSCSSIRPGKVSSSERRMINEKFSFHASFSRFDWSFAFQEEEEKIREKG